MSTSNKEISKRLQNKSLFLLFSSELLFYFSLQKSHWHVKKDGLTNQSGLPQKLQKSINLYLWSWNSVEISGFFGEKFFEDEWKQQSDCHIQSDGNGFFLQKEEEKLEKLSKNFSAKVFPEKETYSFRCAKMKEQARKRVYRRQNFC